MRTLNVRLAAILLVGLVSFAVGVHLLHGYQIRRNARVLLDEGKALKEQAEKAEQAGDLVASRQLKTDAAKQMGWYLNLWPDDLAVKKEHALLLADLAYDSTGIKSTRLFLETLNRLEALVREDPKQADARKKLVDMEMKVGRITDAKEHLQGYLLREKPDDPELLQLLADCQIALAEYNAARESLEKVIRINPQQYRAYPRLAVLLRVHLSQPRAGDELMRKLVQDNPNAYLAHLLRGHYLGQFVEPDEAYEEVMKALKLAPDNSEVLKMAAHASLWKRRAQEALEYASQGAKLYPREPDFYNLISVAELNLGHQDKAIEALQKGVMEAEQNVRLMQALADLLIDVGRIKEAEALIAELRDPDLTAELDRSDINHLAAYLAARVDFTQGRWLQACEAFERVRGPLMRWQFLLPRIDMGIAKCYRQLGNRDQEEKTLRRLLSVDPNYTPAKQALVELLSAKGKEQSALDEIEQMAAEGQTGPGAVLAKAQLLYQKTLRQPRSSRDWAAVETAINEAANLVPNMPQLDLLRAEMLIAQERFDEAEKGLLAAQKKNPKQALAYVPLLLRLALLQKQWEKAESVVRELEQQFGDKPQTRLARGNLLAAKDGKNAKEPLRKLAANLEKFSDAEQTQLWSGLYQLSSQIGDTAQADAAIDRLMEKQPNNSQLRYLSFERAYRTNDRKGMQEALEAIEKVAGKRWYWLYAQAVLWRLRAAETKDRELSQQALENLAKARETRSDWSRIPFEEGLIYDQMGNVEEALKAYAKAFELGDRSILVVAKLIDYLVQSQQFAEADRRLQELEKEMGTLPLPLRRASTEIALQQGKVERSAEVLAQMSPEELKEYRDQFWYGRFCYNLSKQMRGREALKFREAGEKALRRAAETDPQRPDAWLVLVQYFVEQGKPTEAEAVVQEATGKLASDVVSVTMARCNEMLKKTDEAEKLYVRALASSPKDISVLRSAIEFYGRSGKFAEAERLLRKVMDGQIPAKAPEIVWARRQLATILSMQGGRARQTEASKLVEQNLASNHASASDRRLKAQMLAGEPSRARREEAAAILSALLDEQLATAEDRFLLAKLYNSVGEWAKANEQLRFLAVTFESEPGYLVALIEGLLNHNASADADFYLTRLEKLTPAWYRAVHLRVWQLCEQNEPERAKDVLMRFLDNPQATPPDRSSRVRIVADEFEQMSKRLKKPEQKVMAEEFASRAEMLYEAYVKERPGRELVLAAFLARQGKIDLALDMLAKTPKDHPPGEITAVAVSIMANPKVTAEQWARLFKVLDAFPRDTVKSVPLMLALGDVQMRRGNIVEAEKMYQEVMAKHPDNFVAKNNLAVLWALQGKKLDEALKLIDAAIEIAGPVGQILDSRAMIYTAMQQYDKALEDLDLALQEQETAERLFHQALTHYMQGNQRAARSAMERAVEKGLDADAIQPLERPNYEKLKKLMQ